MGLGVCKTFFSEFNQAAQADCVLLKTVVQPLRDPPLSEQGADQLKQIITYSRKKTSLIAGVVGDSEVNIALLVANLAFGCQLPVLFVTADYFCDLLPSELSRLFADLEHQKAILLFDEADALLSGEIAYTNNGAKLDTGYLLKLCSQRQGLTFFSMKKEETAEAFGLRSKFLIEFA